MILRIRAKNFLGYKDVDVDFSSYNLLGIIGKNASGKSSLLETIAFAAYNIGRDNIEKLRKDNTSEEFYVELTYKLNSRLIFVIGVLSLRPCSWVRCKKSIFIK